MIGKFNRPVKLWVIMVTAVVVWMLSTGFQRADSAGKEDLYEQLKIFSDVMSCPGLRKMSRGQDLIRSHSRHAPGSGPPLLPSAARRFR
jgi:hypothetical protein